MLTKIVGHWQDYTSSLLPVSQNFGTTVRSENYLGESNKFYVGTVLCSINSLAGPDCFLYTGRTMVT